MSSRQNSIHRHPSECRLRTPPGALQRGDGLQLTCRPTVFPSGRRAESPSRRKMREISQPAACPDLRRLVACRLHRERSAGRSKPLPRAVRGSGKPARSGDESATVSVNLINGRAKVSRRSAPRVSLGFRRAVAGLLTRRHFVHLGDRFGVFIWIGGMSVGFSGALSFVVGCVAACGIFLYIRVYGEDDPAGPEPPERSVAGASAPAREPPPAARAASGARDEHQPDEKSTSAGRYLPRRTPVLPARPLLHHRDPPSESDPWPEGSSDSPPTPPSSRTVPQ